MLTMVLNLSIITVTISIHTFLIAAGGINIALVSTTSITISSSSSTAALSNENAIHPSTSIFDVMLSSQISNCSSFINAKNQSITDPQIKYPPPNSDKLNYEYIITTPNFPKNYPTNIECISLIKAPNNNYQIMLEVREKFDLEPSKECLSDYIEIADGPFGFSKKIGKFCDQAFIPKEIKSEGPFLWLRFVSDATLPHSGFKLVYRFIRKNVQETKTSYCYKQMMIPAGGSLIINTTFLLTELKRGNLKLINTNKDGVSDEMIPIQCVFDLYVDSHFSTLIHQADFKLNKLFESCQDDFLEIYHQQTTKRLYNPPEVPTYYKICSENDFKQRLFVESTRTIFRISTTNLESVNAMIFHITSMKKYKSGCPENFYHCEENKLCIRKELLCNHQMNCPDNTDENCLDKIYIKPGAEINTTTVTEKIKTRKQIEEDAKKVALEEANKMHAIILGSISAILLLFMVICFSITIHSKKKDGNKIQINMIDAGEIHKCSSNKKLFYEQLQSSEPSLHALSTDKSTRKIYNDDERLVWAKRTERFNDNADTLKLNGGINNMNSDFSNSINVSSTNNIHNKSIITKKEKIKKDKSKQPGLNKIGKYLSEPNPPKTKSINSIKHLNNSLQNNDDIQYKLCNPLTSDYFQCQANYRIVSPSNTSTNSYFNQPGGYTSGILENFKQYSDKLKQNCRQLSENQIQRASSMGSGLRQTITQRSNGQTIDNVDDQFSGNVEWYCGPVIKARSSGSVYNENTQSMEILQADLYGPPMLPVNSHKSIIKSLHVPGCRSLPNVNNIGLQQTPVYYTKPHYYSGNDNHEMMGQNVYPELTTDYSDDDISSYRDDTPSISIHNPFPAVKQEPDNRNHCFQSSKSKNPYIINSSHLNPSKSLNIVSSIVGDKNCNGDDTPSSYGFKYFCAHDPSPLRENDFIEYIA